jgi:hypothetical protein
LQDLKSYDAEVLGQSELEHCLMGQMIHLDQFEDAAPFKLFLLRAPQKHLPIRVHVAWRYFAAILKNEWVGA